MQPYRTQNGLRLLALTHPGPPRLWTRGLSLSLIATLSDLTFLLFNRLLFIATD